MSQEAHIKVAEVVEEQFCTAVNIFFCIRKDEMNNTLEYFRENIMRTIDTEPTKYEV
jgi:hypothetical protein